MLRSFDFKSVYRSEDDNILEDFYLPALSSSILYKRSVGYFSAAMLSYASQGLSEFLANNGKMQLIFGGEIAANEAAAIEDGYDIREINARLGVVMAEEIDSISDALCYRRLEALAWLVATGRLEVKLALRRKGMYHEKIGIFCDADGDKVVFQGSANETRNALDPDFNFESINVFPCWKEEFRSHFTPYLQGFERLWANKARETWVVDFPEAAMKKLVKIAERCKYPTAEQEIALVKHWQGVDIDQLEDEHKPCVPKIFGGTEFAMLPHQLEALNAWKARDLRGIFAHSTGSGKTIAAIYGASKVFDATKRLALVIAVPYINLADQWVEVLSKFQMNAIKCYGSKGSWNSQLSDQVDMFKAGVVPFLCVVVVNRTMQSENFKTTISRIPSKDLLFIGDECHHHSSVKLSSALPSARMRLGLSATPKHYVDQVSTDRLITYYGEIASEFTLSDALEAGVVTPYKYNLSVVSMNQTESEEYLELSGKIAALSARGGGNDDTDGNTPLKALLMRRARLLGSVEDKLVVLRQLLQSQKPNPLTLFYCGDGCTEGDDPDESLRDIDRTTELLYDLGWNCATFTARESLRERKEILSAFRLSTVDALVAIRCLDEGIDVPACRTAYLLASARNPKQGIQRRGRILRKSPGKKFATVHDFLVRLPVATGSASQYERRLLIAELERVAEFSRLSLNPTDSVRTLMPLLEEYDLAHMLV